MLFEFSVEQEILRDQAHRFLSEKFPIGGSYPASLVSDQQSDANWEAIANLGWLGVCIPESAGGLGMRYMDLCVLAEELGRQLSPLPTLSSVYLSTPCITLANESEEKVKLLEAFAAGKRVATLVHDECASSTYRTASSGLRLNDGKIHGVFRNLICHPNTNTLLLWSPTVCGQNELIVADLSGQDFSCQIETSIDDTQPLKTLVVNGAPFERLRYSRPLSEVVAGLVNIAATLVAFEQIGGAEAALQEAVAYARDRYAFGRPIGSFQAIKHRLADCFCALEIARSNAMYACWAVDASEDELPLSAATARVAATYAFEMCARENLQIHGGLGFTWEANCHKFVRRSRHLAMCLGGALEWKLRITDHLSAETQHSKTAGR